MPLVAAKCTQCGANIEIDATKEAGICPHCGTAFVTQKVINNQNTYITQNITKHIHGKEKTEAEEYLANGEIFIKLKDWNEAIKAFMQAAEAAPSNYKCWLGLVRSETKNFTDLDDTCHIEHYRKALAVADDDEITIVKDFCEKFVQLSKNHREKQKGLKEERQKETEALIQEKSALQKKSKKLYVALLTAGIICIFCGVSIILPLSFVASWMIMVPIGFVLIVIATVMWIIAFKAQRKSWKLSDEIHKLNNSEGNIHIDSNGNSIKIKVQASSQNTDLFKDFSK